jgi:2'-5' RNA ligase
VIAVASLLDDPHDRLVRALWGELARDFGVLRVTEIVRDPHVTYQGAEQYDLDRLDTTLRAVAAATAPFTIYTTGLGIFTGLQPVLYLAVVRSAALATLHTALWDAVGTAGRDYSPLYAPAGPWTPHITLAQWDLTPDNIGPIVARLANRPLAWEIPIDNLAILRLTSPDADRYEVWRRYPLAATVP